ncbi:hypothetical protein ABH920_004318 [Catenulispora sp. EB89]|uniref:hypothetical protein n=1 Tax=Catenulispora sp. EB89 TaxID=3156257 RepID=UPI003518FC57
MIRIHLDPATLARTRITTSPLAESVCALELVQRFGPRAPWPYTAWSERAWKVLRADERRLAPLRIYGHLQEWQQHGPTPDFFEPVPEAPHAEMATELASLRGTPPEVVASQLARHFPHELPKLLVPFRDDFATAIDALADALEHFWHQAVEPLWPKMRAALDEEVLLRARSLASLGPESLLAALGSEHGVGTADVAGRGGGRAAHPVGAAGVLRARAGG